MFSNLVKLIKCQWVVMLLCACLLTPSARAQDVRFDTLLALQATTPIPNSRTVPSDFNGDGVSDLLWFNQATSQVGFWLLSTDDTGAVTRIVGRTINVTPGYFVGAVGDFNHDGLADIVFTSASHDLWMWTNDGAGGFTAKHIADYPADWQLVGAGDIDGDGYDDLLWLNASSCQFSYWRMQGGVRLSYRIINVGCGYYPLAVGYFTPSNRLTVLWTSPQKDLFAWDSTGDGFRSWSLGAVLSPASSTDHLWALGGGYAGIGITLDMGGSDSNYVLGSLSRNMGIDEGQLAYKYEATDSGAWLATWQQAGFLIKGGNTNKAGMIFQYGGAMGNRLEICPPVGGLRANPGASPGHCPSFTYPAGWQVVGALANDVVPITQG
jgi:hypothetical protein